MREMIVSDGYAKLVNMVVENKAADFYYSTELIALEIWGVDTKAFREDVKAAGYDIGEYEKQWTSPV